MNRPVHDMRRLKEPALRTLAVRLQVTRLVKRPQVFMSRPVVVAKALLKVSRPRACGIMVVDRELSNAQINEATETSKAEEMCEVDPNSETETHKMDAPSKDMVIEVAKGGGDRLGVGARESSVVKPSRAGKKSRE